MKRRPLYRPFRGPGGAPAPRLRPKLVARDGLIRRGMAAAGKGIYDENALWCHYSDDKIDIGNRLMEVLRALFRGLPLGREIRAMSLGCGDEPQFKILEAAARGGLCLLDIDRRELDAVRERIARQHVDHVVPIRADFDTIFLRAAAARKFVAEKLRGARMDLITLHHSLYYCPRGSWRAIFDNLAGIVLKPRGAVHAVLMASRSNDRRTTTWLYNHFAGKFCGAVNDQDLAAFAGELQADARFRKDRILARTDRVRFFAGDFGEFMAVVWMIMLYPSVHRYTPAQRREITEYVYETFWKPRRPLIQAQDHLVVYRGLPAAG